MWLSSFPNTIYWRDCSFCIVYSWLLCCKLTDHICLGLFLGSILFHWSLFVFMSISYCFYYSSFAIQFEIRKHDTSSFILLSQGCFDYLGSFILQFLHSPSKEHFSCFQVLAIMNKATINMCAGFCVDISFQLLWVNTKECDCWIVW